MHMYVKVRKLYVFPYMSHFTTVGGKNDCKLEKGGGEVSVKLWTPKPFAREKKHESKFRQDCQVI